jgi:predicted dehydrogenase
MAASPSSGIVGRAPALCREGANVVVVGDVGLDLDRRPFYERELTLRFARSYGPGRYERSYEEWGVDLPPGLVRWTEGRNFEAVLDLLAAGRLQVADLVTHRFPIADAPRAYELVESGAEPSMGIVFNYPDPPEPNRPIVLRPARRNARYGVGLIGAGAFARTVLVPAFKEAGFERFVSVTSASGLSARRMAERAGFERAVSGAEAVIDDPDVEVVVIATPHESHARLTAQALRAGKHVFCEKPLALSMKELDDVDAAWQASGRVLFVGFNRRWSESVRLVREHFAPGSGPLVVTYRVNAVELPSTHWYHDRRQGGRLLGEVCHFIDTCAAIVGSNASDIRALPSISDQELLLAEAWAILLRYPDGSLATITYTSCGHPSTEKERVDILGRNRSATIFDFHSIQLNGKTGRFKADKGHLAECRHFWMAVHSTDSMAHSAQLSSTRSALQVVSRSGNS